MRNLLVSFFLFSFGVWFLVLFVFFCFEGSFFPSFPGKAEKVLQINVSEGKGLLQFFSFFSVDKLVSGERYWICGH